MFNTLRHINKDIFSYSSTACIYNKFPASIRTITSNAFDKHSTALFNIVTLHTFLLLECTILHGKTIISCISMVAACLIFHFTHLSLEKSCLSLSTNAFSLMSCFDWNHPWYALFTKPDLNHGESCEDSMTSYLRWTNGAVMSDAEPTFPDMLPFSRNLFSDDGSGTGQEVETRQSKFKEKSWQFEAENSDNYTLDTEVANAYSLYRTTEKRKDISWIKKEKKRKKATDRKRYWINDR